MGTPGLQKINRYSDEFKATAVALSDLLAKRTGVDFLFGKEFDFDLGRLICRSVVRTLARLIAIAVHCEIASGRRTDPGLSLIRCAHSAQLPQCVRGV